uniref:BHLH domain-containing protein n=1 Tax=Rhizophora mucronata TaxID=61149 RepID=A0A2P2JY40_RHIMU
MQSDQQFHQEQAVPPLASQGGNDCTHIPAVSSSAAILPPTTKNWMPFHGVEFQPSDVCPRNFIIFDQNDHQSQIMFHPAMAHKFSGPGLNMSPAYFMENVNPAHFQGNIGRKDSIFVERDVGCSLKEDSDDIDVLLSLEEEEQEEYDEEELSTARTFGTFGSNSPDSCSISGSKPRKSSFQNSLGGSSCNNERKRQKMKTTLKALRGIVPGGDQMNTATVLNEAVRYLKSLKVEVQKLGVRNFKD